MTHIFDDRYDGRENERRDIHADHLSYADSPAAAERGYADRRGDFEWRYSWLRARIRRVLRE